MHAVLVILIWQSHYQVQEKTYPMSSFYICEQAIKGSKITFDKNEAQKGIVLFCREEK